jgi:hypothetical protein
LSRVTNASPLPPPWPIEEIPGGYAVKDATGQSPAYVWAHADADTAKVLTSPRGLLASGHLLSHQFSYEGVSIGSRPSHYFA